MVSVPVLSTMSVSTAAIRSRASASLISTPACAPRPAAVVIEIGVASPSAQGQAIISTETAEAMAKTSAGSGPKIIHTTKAKTATATTVGTKTDETRSASPWIGARDRRAFDTIATICARTVSDPTLPASITKEPFLLIVAPVTASPGPFSTGMDSPVSMLSSSEDRPSITVPSTGTASPGRTRNRSPCMMFSSGASYSVPSGRMRRAVLGARSSSARIASPVRSRARNSRTWPTKTSATITTAASK